MHIIRSIFKWTFRVVLLLVVLGFIAGLIAYWRSANDCGRYATAPTNPMKAIVYCDYGVANLKLEDIEKPAPTDEQVLIKVKAASVNPYDWHFIEGTPYFIRMMVGLRKPKESRVGVDFAGTVEAVGKNVTRFKPGDEVFGGRDGAFAEYICARADKAVALKPAGMGFDQAASINIAGLTALQAVRDKGKVQSGQRVLINGASGGVGTFAVQIAKSYGAEVTGVCSGRNAEMVKGLGADHVIDYTKEDFTKNGEHYDVILDNVGNHSLSECRRVLTPTGKFVMIGGGSANEQGIFGVMLKPLKAMVMSKFVKQEMGMMMAKMNHDDLALIAEMIQSGKVKPVIDRQYKLSEAREAVRYVEEGHARGKVIIAMD